MAQAKKKPKRSIEASEIILADMEKIGRIPTDIAPFDLYTQGGIPEGTISLFSGREGSGKTTTALKALAGFQKLYPKKSVFYLNAEKLPDPHWIKTLGGNPKKISVLIPDNTEEAQYLVGEVAVEREDVGFVIVDSLAALCPEKETEADPSEEQMGIAARLNNKFMRRLTALQLTLFKLGRPLTVILINQERESLKLYGETVIPGGKGQRYHAALWCKFLKSENKVDMKLGVPVLTTFRAVLIKNIGNPSQWPWEADMCMTPHEKYLPGQFIDQEFIWMWATQRFGLMKNRGTKGYEYQGTSLPKSAWITQWEDDKEAYRKIKIDVQKEFSRWLEGELKANFIKPEEGDANEHLAEVGEAVE